MEMDAPTQRPAAKLIPTIYPSLRRRAPQKRRSSVTLMTVRFVQWLCRRSESDGVPPPLFVTLPFSYRSTLPSFDCFVRLVNKPELEFRTDSGKSAANFRSAMITPTSLAARHLNSQGRRRSFSTKYQQKSSLRHSIPPHPASNK